MTELDRLPTRFASRVAVTVLAVVALAVCAAASATLAGLLAVAGALGATWAVERLDGETNVARATGSIALVASVLCFVTGVLLSTRNGVAGVTVPLVAGAVLVAALNARVEMDRKSVDPAESALGHSTLLVGLGALAAGAFHLNFASLSLLAVSNAAVDVHSYGTLAQFVSLQALALAVSLLLPRALSTLDDWVPGDAASDGFGFLERVGIDPEDVPRTYWALFGGQLLFLVTDPALFDRFLDLLSVLGTAIRVVLGSGVLHLPLAAFAVAAAGVLVAELLRRGVVAWGGNYPPKTLGYAAGGVAVAFMSLVFTVPPVAARAEAVFGGPAWAQLGAVTVVLTAVLLVLLATYLAERFVVTTAWVPFLPVLPFYGIGFAAAGGLLFAGTVAAAEGDAHPLVVVSGVAASLFVWDAGDYATRLGRELGRTAETRRAELVHLTGSALVGAVGIALATVALYGVGPASVPGGERTAVVALFATLVALGGLVWLLVGDGDERAT